MIDFTLKEALIAIWILVATGILGHYLGWRDMGKHIMSEFYLLQKEDWDAEKDRISKQSDDAETAS